MTEPKCPVGISGSTLKLIAIVTMLIDHFGATVLRTVLNHPDLMERTFGRSLWIQIYFASRSLGRIAFPIFCFLIVEGFIHTRNVWKYAGRLFLFALISELPFDLALKGDLYFPQKQNVYFTLLIGLLVLIGISFCEQLPKQIAAKKVLPERKFFSFFTHLLSIFLAVLILFFGMELAKWIDTDYNYKGVFLIAILYLLRHSRLFACTAGAAAVAWELPAPVSFLPIYLYNGTRGRQMKYLFYWFYPVHLLILHMIAQYLIPLC